MAHRQSGPQHRGHDLSKIDLPTPSLPPFLHPPRAGVQERPLSPCFLMAHVYHTWSFPNQTFVCMVQSLLDDILQVSGGSSVLPRLTMILPSQDHHCSKSPFATTSQLSVCRVDQAIRHHHSHLCRLFISRHQRPRPTLMPTST
jgi:hypothetical protein